MAYRCFLFSILAFLYSPGGSYALGVGDISLHTSLHQPLQADIELLRWRDVDFSRLEIGLASQSDYSAYGIDWQRYLNYLQFELVNKGSDKYSILVTGDKAVREPYLNFLIKLRWPGGSLLREYVLLFDLPEKVKLASAEPTNSPSPLYAAKAELAGLQLAEIYTTGPGDNLWSIAKKFWPDNKNVNIYQVMLAIHEANPRAFVNTNIALLKSRQKLRGPSLEQILRYSGPDAQIIFDKRMNIAKARIAAVRLGYPLPSFNIDITELLSAQQQLPPTEVPLQPIEAEQLSIASAVYKSGKEGEPLVALPPQEELEQGVLSLLEPEVALAATDQAPDPDSAPADEGYATVLESNNEQVRDELLDQLLLTQQQEISLMQSQMDDLSNQLQQSQALASRLAGSLEMALKQAQEAEGEEPVLSQESLNLSALAALFLTLLAGLFIYLRFSNANAAKLAAKQVAYAEQEAKEAAMNLPVIDTPSLETIPEPAVQILSVPILQKVEEVLELCDYSKAIELLELGIERQPKRVDLHLKMLEVCTLAEDSERFHRYDSDLSVLSHEALVTSAELRATLAADELEPQQDPIAAPADEIAEVDIDLGSQFSLDDTTAAAEFDSDKLETLDFSFDDEEPSASGKEPSASGEEPSASGKESSASGEEPSANGEESSANGEESSANGEESSASDAESPEVQKDESAHEVEFESLGSLDDFEEFLHEFADNEQAESPFEDNDSDEESQAEDKEKSQNDKEDSPITFSPPNDSVED